MDDLHDGPAVDDEVPGHGAGHATRELHYGRTGWLAEHIRRSDFNIHPMVARKLLALIEGGESNLYFELKLVRRSDLPPAFKDPRLILHRDVDMAYEVGRKSGFRRGLMKAAVVDVAERYGLSAASVYKLIAPHKEEAMEILAQERMAEAYRRGGVDFLGRLISPPIGFEDDQEGA